ncbi:hypothetical protein JCM15457_935 [Liquorilactobacillus sucicola DSM 21376 = JCM 15457]|uniref:Uncharacterized protein n=1 Tax=Liquorilactobacillus sucicola DSM 21376 = JCM 15457 TaxID=1423806 RepID=A0A023CWX0_9LACO|nr:hypothetical protein [Liquorilactobacillus sucicola]KRN06099.1 hypothetical protein FD15_GL001291 [Liquorilactobacillus sucicola DSM 21376 = JCM 15457]GAJ26025.1 hypothetical protein JCM15457_935 [Liquorilactobacillus sucicola DSM 21376 = JCM 15457]
MSLFNNNKKAEGLLEDRGLANLDRDAFWQVRAILSELEEQQLLKNSKKVISSDYVAEKATASYLRAIVEQNWVLIAQNDQIIKSLNSKNNTPVKKE